MICDEASENAITAAYCLAEGWFDSIHQANACLLHMERNKKLLKFAGTVRLRNFGRPCHVYTKGWTPQPAKLKHEVMLSDIKAMLKPKRYNRRFVDKAIRADLEVWLENEDGEEEKWFIEFDCNSMNYGDIADRRFPVYYNADAPVLYIVHDDSPKSAETRMNGLRLRAGKLKDAFFTTTYRFAPDPFGSVLVDAQGNPARLPSPMEKVAGKLEQNP